ncbi:hypothetical protein NHI83_003473 [Salmonella enterica]|nr:hypothetical protein [Salmonella enterica]EJJ0090699.1 hypothetical protein [Salmonella enterica]EJJ3876577.1 hypothetical protein [Salmonella enterica]EJJ4298400.1 hypothetical protein [Salmonella enterica]EJJ4308792.1 hypothetical protein [Salmonella enterica]
MGITKGTVFNPGVAQATGQGGDLTTVKTDGTTITGNGNTTPIALGPGVRNGIGAYAMAYCSSNGSGRDAYGQTIAGSLITPTSVNVGPAPRQPQEPGDFVVRHGLFTPLSAYTSVLRKGG